MPLSKSKEDTWSQKELENQLTSHNSSNMDAKKMKTTNSEKSKSDKKENLDNDKTEKHRSSSKSKKPTEKATESKSKSSKNNHLDSTESNTKSKNSINNLSETKPVKEKSSSHKSSSDKTKSSSDKVKASKSGEDQTSVKTKVKKNTSDESTKVKVKTKVNNHEDDDYNDYEDDFEVYEEDKFDKYESSDEEKRIKKKEKSKKLEESETTKKSKSTKKSSQIVNEIEKIDNINELQMAMKLEEEKLLNKKNLSDDKADLKASKSNKKKTRNSPEPTELKSSTIDFKKREKPEETKRLADEIEESTKGTSQYEIIFLNYVNSNKSLVYSQTGEEDISVSLQTEEIPIDNKWTQHPMHVSLQASGDDSTKTITELDSTIDSILFNKFIQNAGKVMLSVLEENVSENLFKNVKNVASNFAVSEAFIELKTIDLLKDRTVTFTAISQLSNHIFLSIHRQTNKMSVKMDQKGTISLWNIYESELPKRILLSESQANCCCFHPTSTNIIFAGLTDGTIAVWDIKEKPFSVKSNIAFQYQTYTTASQRNENHYSEVLSITPIVSQNKDIFKQNLQNNESSAFQLATLETDSAIYLWVMSDCISKDAAGSQSELGLAPGAKIKLIKSQYIKLSHPIKSLSLTSDFIAFDLKVLPSDNQHIFICTNVEGCILHQFRFRDSILPRTYKSNTTSNVSSIDFSPFMESIFLTGYEDGTISLFHLDMEEPLTSWVWTTEGSPISCLRWCRSRPSVFFALDCASNFYIWDLSVDSTAPLKSQRTFNKKALTFFLSGNKDYKQDSQSQNMVIFYEDGSIELHKVKPELSALLSNEMHFFVQLIQSFF